MPFKKGKASYGKKGSKFKVKGQKGKGTKGKRKKGLGGY